MSEAGFEGILTNDFPKMVNTHRFKHLTNPKQKEKKNYTQAYQIKIVLGKKNPTKTKV